eukprot:TRINITY_DN10426_c0_g1_i1.p1 TRINITY_DN10426_c0_g1~~TRINITY_DN10426_c0_g1_i1.p1  ORF type:complete len:185 (+),score=34.32 TRINITY_DN10426_c0_g1_i1:55-609(+)
MPRVPNQLTKVAKTVTLKTTTRASITPLINSTHTHLININTTTVSSSSTSSLSSLSSYTTFPQRQFSPLNTTSIPSTTNTTSPLVSSSSSQSSQNGIIHRSLFTTPGNHSTSFPSFFPSFLPFPSLAPLTPSPLPSLSLFPYPSIFHWIGNQCIGQQHGHCHEETQEETDQRGFCQGDPQPSFL